MSVSNRFGPGRVALVLFVLALGFRLAYLVQITPLPFTTNLSLDAASYDSWAQEIAAGNWLGEKAFYQAPLYPYFLGILYRCFGHHLTLVRVLQLLLGAVNCLLVFWMGRKIFGTKRALWSGIFALFYGILVFYDGAIGKDGLSIFLSDLTLLGLLWSAQKPKATRWALSGIAFGCAVLTRGNLLLLAPVVLTWMVLANKQQRPKIILAALAAFVAGTAVPITPVTVRNYVVSRDFVLTTSQAGQNFYIGNNPKASGFFENPERIRLNPKYEEDDFEAEALRRTGRTEMKPSEISSFWFQEGIRYVRTNPGRALDLLIKKTALFWNQFEIPDNYNYYFFKEEAPVLRLLFLGFGVVAPLGLLGLFLARKKPGTWLFALFIFGYMVSIVPFHMASRYRLPIVPPLLVFAGYTMHWAIERIGCRDFKKLFFAVIALACLAVAVHWKVADETYTFKAPYTELGIIAAEQGDHETAVAYYQKALAMDPAYAPALYNLGNTMAEKGRYREAVSAYQRALKSDPEFLMAYDNLGKTYLRLGLADEALKNFNAALQRRADFSEAWAGKGLVYHRLGRYDEAIDAYHKAISSDPSRASAYYNLACAFGRKGDRENAETALKKAVALKPEYEQLARRDEDLQILRMPFQETP